MFENSLLRDDSAGAASFNQADTEKRKESRSGQRDWFSGGKRVSFAPMNAVSQEKPLDPRMAVRPDRRRTDTARMVACGAVIVLLTACVAANPTKQDSQAVAASSMGTGETPAVEKAGSEPTDENVMYHVFAGEFLGSEGDLKAAVDEYLQAALGSDDPEIARRATRIAFAAEAWLQADMAADRWALLDPTSVNAQRSAAGAKLRLGDFLGAEDHLMRILDLMGDSTEAWMTVAVLLKRSGDPVQADEILENIMASRDSANTANALFAKSQLAAQSGDARGAFELARRAVERQPERVELLTWAGRLALNLNLPDTGLEYIRRAWNLNPEDHDLSLAYADLLARTGHPDTARRIMREMKQTPDVMLSRILFELAAKDRTAAERLFSNFVAMDFPDPDEKAFYLGQSAEALDHTKQAIDFYAQVRAGDRAMAAAIRRAELMAAKGQLDEARNELATLRLQSDAAVVEESWLAEARILRGAGEREEAFRVLESALDQFPRSIAVLYSHSLLAAELGRVDVAEHDLRTIIAADPENATALNALGYTLADQTQRYKEAEALIRQAYILQPNEPSIIDSMGWIAYRLGRLEDAEDYLQKAWRLNHNPEIAAHLGEVLWVSGKREEARAVWREGMEVDAQNPVLLKTLERLGADL